MASFDDLKMAAKELALVKYKNESDEVLREIVQRNTAQMMVNSGLSEAEMIHKMKLAGEGEGCAQILNSRQKASGDLVKKMQEWRENLPKRKAKAILNLPNAASPNGQLVAAILEETPEGLTEKQIAAWCDELSAIPEVEFHALLNSLIVEGILKVVEGRYLLCNVLDSSMLPSLEYARGKLHKEDEAVKAAYAFMVMQNRPVSTHELNQMLGREDNEAQDSDTDYHIFFTLRVEDLVVDAFDINLGIGRGFRNYYAPRLLGEEVD